MYSVFILSVRLRFAFCVKTVVTNDVTTVDINVVFCACSSHATKSLTAISGQTSTSSVKTSMSTCPTMTKMAPVRMSGRTLVNLNDTI